MLLDAWMGEQSPSLNIQYILLMAAQKYSLLSDTLSINGRDYLNLMALGLIMAAMAYLAKITLTVAIIVLVSETSNRSLFLASLFASIPIVSILAIVWMHNDGKSGQDIAIFADGVLLLIIPSLICFLLLSYLLRNGWDFYPSLGIGVLATVIAYLIFIRVIERMGWIATQTS
jgi:hypothetical protein